MLAFSSPWSTMAEKTRQHRTPLPAGWRDRVRSAIRVVPPCCANEITASMYLRLRGIDVTTTSEAGLMAAPDEMQFAFAISQGRVLFTHDQDFLKPPFRDAGDHAGIVYCRQDAYTLGELIRSLSSLARAVPEEDMKGRIKYL